MSDAGKTAANILASLGVRGATVGERIPGCVPMLDGNGMLSANLIPQDLASLSAMPLSDMAFVDPYTEMAEYAEDGTTRLRTGSAIAPFKGLGEAAANFSVSSEAASSGIVALLLVPGKYDDPIIEFSGRPSKVFLIGLGECILGASVAWIKGLASQAELHLYNITTSHGITVQQGTSVTCLGRTRIGELLDASAIRLSPESRVDSTDSTDITFLADASKVSNGAGGTVSGSLEALSQRKIRVLKISGGSSGLTVDSSSFEDVTAGSSSGVFDLRQHESVIVNALKSLTGQGGYISADTVRARSVVAERVSAEALEAGAVDADAMLLGGYKLVADAYGYLSVVDAADEPTQPPEDAVAIRDSVTGAVYTIGVQDGRANVSLLDADGSSSDSYGYELYDIIEILDGSDGDTYSLTMEDGRLVIRKNLDGSSSDSSSQA